MSRNQTSKHPSSDIDAQIQRAFALHQQGNLADAEKIYTDILRKAPNHFGALSLLGAIACQSGAYERAVTLLSKATSINPNVAPAHSNLAVALRELKRFKEALISCDKAIALKPDYVEAYYNRGLTLEELGRIENALSSFDKALSLKPSPEVYYSRGNALRELGRFRDALLSYENAIALNPTFAEAHFNRGNALKELGRPQEALVSYERAIALKPGFAEVHHNRGVVLNELGRLDESLVSYERVVALQPDNADAYFERSVVLRKLGQLNRALESCERAIALRPHFPEAFYNKGNIFRELDRLNEACDSFRHAVALKPDFVAAYNNIGLSLIELGQTGEAQEAFRKALDIEPRNATALSNLSHAKKFAAGDPHLDVMQELLANPELLSESERIELNFALGKVYADLKDHRRSFEHLLAANRAKRAIFPYDEQAALATFDLLERTFTRELINSKSGSGDPSRQPIFILGMPRSGTTLVEQILASHPEVYGAGESDALQRTVQAMYRADGATVPYPYFVPALDSFALAGLGARYLAAINEGGPKNKRISDKMLANSMFVGLIHLILPNAKIIHSIRDPIDNCISCFSILFTKGQNFAYDLGELGRYYKGYERLMAHWHDVLPEGRILDVKYEDVVADVETQARRILAYCELPWDDRCLSFYETERPVRTASMTQVRQPIYQRSIGRWRVYQEFIGPLLEALGEPSDEEHIADVP